MKDELEGIWNEAVGEYSRFYRVISLLGVRKSTKTIKIAGVSAEIQTEHLPNSVPEY
jgi:hypothetical protein